MFFHLLFWLQLLSIVIIDKSLRATWTFFFLFPLPEAVSSRETDCASLIHCPLMNFSCRSLSRLKLYLKIRVLSKCLYTWRTMHMFMCTPVIRTLWTLKQQDCKLEAWFGYIVRFFFSQKMIAKKKKLDPDCSA